MIKKMMFSLGAAAALTLALSACAGESGGSGGDEPIGGDIIAPVTMSVNELQGAEVDLIVGQVLNINTDSLSVDSYTAEVADESVAEFTAGRITDGTEFNPGVTGLAVGSTEVTMTNEQGGIQPLEFTVHVTAE